MRSRFSPRFLWTFGTLVALLGTARVALPYVLLRYVNDELSKLTGYRGHVGDLDLALFRGATRVEDVIIEKKATRPMRFPLFAARTVDFSLEWSALLHGAVVGAMTVEQPTVNVVASKSKKEERVRTNAERFQLEQLQDELMSLVPLDIDYVRIHDGQVHFRDFTREPNVHLFITHLKGQAENLTNSASISKRGDLFARAHFTAQVLSSAQMMVSARVDPYAKAPTFDLTARLEELNLRELNDFLRAYANLDVEEGTFSLYSEVTARGGRFEGYAKPFLEDVRVFSWKEKHKNVLQKAWEGLAQVATNLLKNDETKDVATRIPVRGQFDAPDVGIWTAVTQVLRNAFIEALYQGFEGKIDVGERREHAARE